MDYAQTLEYLYSRLPMFHRLGSVAYRANLDNIYLLSSELSSPEISFPSIHIAGTNGKGSVSHMLAAILQKAGYKTGLYTSPHLKDFRERIRINGEMIEKEAVSIFVDKHADFFEKNSLSFFEMTVGLAFDYFRNEKIDYAVIETGLGGRLDATNIIHPLLSIITNISLDHTQILGNTLGEIAIEKAGIIKENTAVVIGESHIETKDIFRKKASELHAEILFADGVWKSVFVEGNYKSLICDIFKGEKLMYAGLKLDLPGHYQLKNVLTVLASVEKLREKGLIINDKDVIEALAEVRSLTGFAGRWQVISEKPLIICDTAHNTGGLKEVLLQLQEIPSRQTHFVLGMVKDKDVDAVLKLFPKKGKYYFCKPDLPRGLDAGELSILAYKHGLEGFAYDSVAIAVAEARKQAAKEDVIYVGGSTFVVAEVI